MQSDTGPDAAESLQDLRRSLGRIADELAGLSARVDRAIRSGAGAPAGPVAAQPAEPAGAGTPAGPVAAQPAEPAGAGAPAGPARWQAAPDIAALSSPPAPSSGMSAAQPISTGRVPSPWQGTPTNVPSSPPGAPGTGYYPSPVGQFPHPPGPFPPPAAAVFPPGPLPPGQFALPPGMTLSGQVRPPPPPPRPGAWADTAGLKLLGWIGGGVTVLGIVLLLVIAAQQGGFSDTARVTIGLVLGVVLLGGAFALHRDARRAALALTLGCTGLAVEYLTIVGAVRLAELAHPMVGFVVSAVIAAVAVALSMAWRQPWLAGASFLISGLLAPAVGDGVTDSVLVFEAIMVAGGAACLLIGVGYHAWIGGVFAAVIVYLAGLADHPATGVGLLVGVVITALAWATMLTRWLTGRAATDPGPFRLRAPSTDPARIAQDYADFHAHQRRRSDAQVDSAIATASIAVTAGLLVVALTTIVPAGWRDLPAAMVAGLLAVIFGVLTWAGRRETTLRRTAVTVSAWSATIALAGLTVARLIGGDARGVAWVMLVAVALALAAADRSVRLLGPALVAALLALLATGTVFAPRDVSDWPSPALVGPGGLLDRGWALVLPTGLGVMVMCAVAWWGLFRCTSSDRGPAVAGEPSDDGWVVDPHRRTTLLTWALVASLAVACYGLLAVAMVVAYAISPTATGHQVGQAAVTVLIILIGLALLWQGFRQVVLRLGGLALAALAVVKLILLDTRSLEAMPRAVTFIGVGVLLLLGAVVYLRTVSRADSRRDLMGRTGA